VKSTVSVLVCPWMTEPSRTSTGVHRTASSVADESSVTARRPQTSQSRAAGGTSLLKDVQTAADELVRYSLRRAASHYYVHEAVTDQVAWSVCLSQS